MQHASVAPHDSIGSNIFVHTRCGEVMRVAPRENEAINEVWLSDRDRFSYEGLYSDDRVTMPMIKVDGAWQETDWDTALQAVVDGIKAVISDQGADQVGLLVSPSSTLEEMTLAQGIARGLGINNIDHRLRQTDFNGQDNAPLYPSLGQSLEALETVNAALVIGSNTRKEQPMAGHRLRKAALAGANIMFINPVNYEINYPVHSSIITAPSQMTGELAAIARAMLDRCGGSAPASVQERIANANPDPQHFAICNTLLEAGNTTVLLGNSAVSHPQFSVINALAGVIAKESRSIPGVLPEAANSVGGWLAGVLPHRGPAGEAVSTAGMNARTMLADPRQAYILLGVEPLNDCQDSAAANNAMQQAGFVVSISPYANDNIKACANVLLPVGPFTETSGTYVNATGEWQSFSCVASPQGESRPAWKVLRVLGNRFGLDGFEYARSEQVRDELSSKVSQAPGQKQISNLQADGAVAEALVIDGLERIGDVAIHSLDPLVRRAASLQATPDAELARKLRMNILQADECGVLGADTVRVIQGERSVTIGLEIDDRVPKGCVWLHTGIDETAGLGAGFGCVEVQKTGAVRG
jgi:NADH-quinone oxidoreductase subunit G